jgi:hypothetical protein
MTVQEESTSTQLHTYAANKHQCVQFALVGRNAMHAATAFYLPFRLGLGH